MTTRGVLLALQGERTYHVFYQLCAGCGSEEQASLQLRAPSDFRYIGESARLQASIAAPVARPSAKSWHRTPSRDTRARQEVPSMSQVPGIDDKSQWQQTCQAMDVFRLAPEEQAGVRRVLAAVLHAGNLEFDAVQMSQQDDGCAVSPGSQRHLESAAQLLAVAPSALLQALTVKSVGKFPVVQVPQPPGKATAARDALSRMLYGQVFDWLLGRLNVVMTANKSAQGADIKRVVGLLDIFGFEAFQRNSLEQLLINFANEKLQQHFNEYIFRLEESECRAEGVACPTLEFADNSAVVALLTSKPTGVLSLINEEVIVPNSSDANLIQKMQQQHRGHAVFKPLPRAQGEGFIVTHFAGPVSYLIDGFVDKNRDALPGELSLLLGTSELPLISALFKKGADAADGAAVAKQSGSASARGGGARARSGGGGGARRNTALASQFQDSLDSLMTLLSGTTPHFVRCVKPNAQLVPERFDGSYVMRQLREMGMVHVVRARKQGYAHRYSFDRFNARYGYLLDGFRPDGLAYAETLQKHLGSATPPEGDRTACVRLMAAMVSASALDAEGWAVGTGKLFMKAQLQQQLEVARESYLRRVVSEQLEKAIAQRDIEVLEKAISAAIEVRLQSPLIAQAQQLLQQLQAQLAATASLQEAMGSRDPSRLEAALTTADQVGLKGELVEQAKQLLTQLRAQQEAAAALAAALQLNELGALSRAIEQAAHAGLNTGTVKEAQRRYEMLLHKEQLAQDLAKESQGTNLQLLTQYLAQAEEIGLDARQLEPAKLRRAGLQEAVQLQSNLVQAAQVGDLSTLRDLIQRGKAAPIQTTELQQAVGDAERALGRAQAEYEERALAESRARAVAEEQRSRQEAEESASMEARQQEARLAQRPAAPTGQQAEQQVAQLTASAASTRAGSAGSWIPAVGKKSVACQPLEERVRQLQNGHTLIKVASTADRWKERCSPTRPASHVCVPCPLLARRPDLAVLPCFP